MLQCIAQNHVATESGNDDDGIAECSRCQQLDCAAPVGHCTISKLNRRNVSGTIWGMFIRRNSLYSYSYLNASGIHYLVT